MRERDGEIDGIQGGDLDSYIRRCPISSDRGFPSVMVAPFGVLQLWPLVNRLKSGPSPFAVFWTTS